MKANLPALLATSSVILTTLTSTAATFFNDTLTGGSTVNATPVNPTVTSTSYEVISSKSWNPTPSLTSGDLKFGIAQTSSGSIEAQALFTNSLVALVVAGDYIEMTVTFTNTAGLLTGSSFLGFGLYNSGHVFPVTNGLNGTATTSSSANATGGAQNWQGYVGQLAFTGANSRIMTRASQTGTANNNQDLVTSGSGSSSYANPPAATVGSNSTNSLTLVAGQTYTEDLKIVLSSSNTLYITNTFYSGPTATGTPLSQFGAEAMSPLTAAFDALAVGWRDTKNSGATTIDISAITVSGQSTPVTGPPSIDTQPASVSVPVGGSCEFAVAATGFGMTYQWHRYGTNLVNGGSISGAASDKLIISPVSSADVASGANGYYVTVTGTGNFSTNSATATLSLRSAINLVWSGSGTTWDLATTADWLDNGSNPSVFNLGDNVTFDDTGSGNLSVTLSHPYLSAGSVTVNSAFDYVLGGTGSFAGSGKLNYIGSGHLRINNANSYSGGTLISNSFAYLVLNNYAGVGTGPVTLAQAGGQMEIIPAGSATVGINGDIIIADDFSILYDATDAFGAVFLGNFSGTAGKTLAIHQSNGSAVSRVRVYGANTVCNANIQLAEDRVLLASYNSTGNQIYNGVVSGNGAFMEKGTTTIFNGANTYSSGTTPAQGLIGLGVDSVGSPTVTSGPIGTGPLYLAPDSTTSLTGNGMIFASGGTRTVANPIQYRSGTNNLTLSVGGTNALIMSGAITLNGNDSQGGPTNRIFQVTNTALTTFSGAISDGGAGFGLLKTGNGILALSNTETYSGSTTVSNGTLLVNGSIGSGAVTVATNATLGGTGTIGGPITIQNGGTLAPGASVGILTINNNLTLAGNLNIEVNKSGSPTSDRTVVSGTLSNTGTGTVTVNNLGPALSQGDTFAIFNKAVTGGAALTVTGANATWTNKLAVDGTIAVVSVISMSPTTLSFTNTGTSLKLSWPGDHTGWTLQAQTNAGGLGTNWGAVAGSTATNQVFMPFNPATGSVFFRLVSP